MSTEKHDQMTAATGYVAALENALYAAIVTLYSTHKADCVNTFTFDELSMVVDKTRNMASGTRLENIYAEALRYPHTTKCRNSVGASDSCRSCQTQIQTRKTPICQTAPLSYLPRRVRLCRPGHNYATNWKARSKQP